MPQFELKNLPLGGVSGIAGNGAGRWLTSADDGSVALTDDLVTYVSGAGPGFVSSSGELCADASRWYMVNYGSFAWSTDGFVGATWATSSLTTLYPGGGGGLGARAIAAGGGRLVVVSWLGEFSVSSDAGASWTLKGAIPGPRAGRSGAAYTGTHWVVWAGGENIAVSADDGDTWTLVTPIPGTKIEGFAFCPAGWMVRGLSAAAKSTDSGATWAPLSETSDALASAAGVIARHTTSDPVAYVTADLATWHAVDLPAEGWYANRLVGGNGSMLLYEGYGGIGRWVVTELAPPPDPDARLPLRLSVVAAPPIRLPLRLSVGSSAPGRPLPLRLSVRAAALAGNFDGAATWSAAPSGQWQLGVELGGADISGRVHGPCTVQIGADAARTADFAFLPTGPLAVMGLVGQRVQIAFSQRGGAGGQVLFRGVVDVPSVDLTTGVVRCACTDQAQELWAAASRESIDTLVGGRWHPAVTGEPDDNYEYLKARLLSVAASWHLDVQQQPRVVQWASPARTLTVRTADVVDGSLSVDLPSRDQLRTQIVCRLQYRYPLHRSRGITAQYRQPLSFFLPWFSSTTLETNRESVVWLTAGMVEGAAGSLPGWELSKPLTVEHPEPGSYLTTRPFLDPVPRAGALTEGSVYVISPPVAASLALGFTASYVARWEQSVTEDYTVTVKWPALEQQLGTVSSEELGATLEATFDSPDWGRDLSVLPQIGASGDGDTSVPWQPAGADPAARDELLRTLLDHAWVRLWSASRTGRVRFVVPCRPDLALSDAVVLEHDRLRASGRVVEVTHSLSMETGEALTEVAVAVGMPGNAPASPPTWSLPAPPVDGYVPPLSAYSCEIGTFVGNTAAAPAFDQESMVGFTTNQEGPTGGEIYPHQLRIRAPGLAAEDRDPLVLTATAEVAVTVPTDLLEVL